MTFNREQDFETALIQAMTTRYGWEKEILKNPTEKELLENWKNIIFNSNRSIDRCGDYPLTDGEMHQIIEQISELKTPLRLNSFIIGKSIAITRDNPDDTRHFGKEIPLDIYDPKEIAAGKTRYQIAQQPKFKTRSSILSDRRGDLMLLINGMPLIHIELKRSGVSVTQACHQIEKYSHEGVFTGIFALVQVFFAMEPNETLYFANPGTGTKFNKDFYFHWADFNNEPINNWKDVAAKLLSIPMAHQLIGYYTVADSKDGVLKVMRSYQYYAANKIADTVANINWDGSDRLGGYIAHTTGSGKTMTSFKSAQLIANSGDANKVIFLMDRIELGTQSLLHYRGFAADNESIQETQNTGVLVKKLKSSSVKNTLIVTSIHKMSNIEEDPEGFNAHDIKVMNAKRIVFIVDEAHRSTFGEMLITIKNTFPSAIFFGFTGTPIYTENQKKMNTTCSIFGNELHRYSIADGIRDENVLGFDPYKILTYRDKDVRQQIALMKAKAHTEKEAIKDPKKSEVYYKYMDSSQIKMSGYKDNNDKYIKGIEDDLPTTQYNDPQHCNNVVKDILENWFRLSKDGKFHAIFATNSIPEAIEYYRIFKHQNPELKVTALFDPNIDNNDLAIYKEDGLEEIITDYNELYKQNFTVPTHSQFKEDISHRLAHKEVYKTIHREPEKQINILIVVDQMLTGFDSKWINTLYLDKVLENEHLIQAFSRTNRIFGHGKPFGTIRYYRKPHSMQRNIETAVKLYSGDKPFNLFVERLDYNLKKLNDIFNDISELFSNKETSNFVKLPKDRAERGKFASLFKDFNNYLEAAKIQGFQWGKSIYEFTKNSQKLSVEVLINEEIYLILALRYKELFNTGSGNGNSNDGEDIPFEIEGHLTEIDTDVINADYMNSRFDKFLTILEQKNVDKKEKILCLSELHKSFANLSQEDQKYANIFLHDVENGQAQMQSGKTFRDYITEYQANFKQNQISNLVEIFDIDEPLLTMILNAKITEKNIDEFGRFTKLKDSVDKTKAQYYFECQEEKKLPLFKVNIKTDKLLRNFIFNDGVDI